MRLIMSKKNRNIRWLESKAKKGELLPAFQLFQNYAHGQGDVEIDKVLANEYLRKCTNYLENKVCVEDTDKPENHFSLNTLELVDFRRFQHLTMNFEPDLTVLIGGNGEGKTTIAHAIAKTLSWVTASIIKEGGAGQRVSNQSDIRNDSQQLFADVILDFSFGKGLKRITGRLSRAALGAENKRDSEIKELKNIANVWRVVNAKHMVNLPLFAFYSVERSYPLDKKSNKTDKEISFLRENRFDAYNDALAGAGKFEHFVEWFIGLHKKTVNDQFGSIEKLIQQVEGLKKSIDSGIDSLKPLFDDAQKQLNEAQLTQRLAKDQHTLTDLQRKEIVVKAICDVIPSVSDIWVETKSGIDTIMVRNDGILIKLAQLSDGQRVFVALVSDLVRRLVLLNPTLDNPLHGQGIVLIDEIELHLHPKWQQDVVLDLQNTFPNIQFIVTTHSPQVLSTVDKRCIRRFGGTNSDGSSIMSPPEFQTKGVVNANVLEQLMDTFAAPQRIPESHWVSDFLQLIEVEPYEINLKAQELYEDIKKHFGEDSFELKSCESQIRLQKMKAKAREKMKQREAKK